MRLLRRFFTTEGRLARGEYIGLQIIFLLCLFPLYMLAFVAEYGIVIIALAMILVAINIFPTIRRLHDVNLPGWVALLWLVPQAGSWVNLFLCFVKGTVGPNKYGDDPKWKDELGKFNENKNF